MSAKELSVEKNVMTVEITIDGEVFKQALNRSYNKNKKYYTVQGFRKGKAPRKLIERYYGSGVFVEDAINFAFPDAYREALEELNVEPVSRPEMTDIKEASDDGAVFVVRFGLKPEVKLGEYKGAEIEPLEVEITDKDVEERLEWMQKQNARLVTVEDAPAEEGDTVNIDYKGFVDDEPFIGGEDHGYDLKLGSNSFIPGFEDQLVGAKAGEEVEVKVTFPEVYHADNLAGKDAVFKVTVNEVKREELPELNDDFAQDVSESDTMEELKEALAKEEKENREATRRKMAEEAVINFAIENAEIELPDLMVEDELDRIVEDYANNIAGQGLKFEDFLKYMGDTKESFREKMRANTVHNIKGEYVLDALVEAENPEVTEEDMENEYPTYAQASNMELDEFKKHLEENEGLKGYIEMGLKRRKVVDAMIDAAKIKEADTKEEE